MSMLHFPLTIENRKKPAVSFRTKIGRAALACFFFVLLGLLYFGWGWELTN